jgi:hypothetical protein
MLTRCIRLAGLTLLFGALVTPAARADTRFDVRIGVPGPMVVAPYRAAPEAYGGLVWQPGYYVWAGYGRRWVPGAWIRPGYRNARPGWGYERRGYDRRDRDDRWERDRYDRNRDRRWDRDERRDRDWRR